MWASRFLICCGFQEQPQTTQPLWMLLVNEDHPSLFTAGGAVGAPINHNAKTTDMYHEYQWVSNYKAALNLFSRTCIE